MECRDNFYDNINNSSFIIKNSSRGLTDDEVHKKLQDLWGGTEYGRKLLEMFIALE